jgi:magnesium transporter
MELEIEKTTLEYLIASFDIENINEFRELFLSYHPYDIALVFEFTDFNQRNRIYQSLSPTELAAIMTYIDADEVVFYFKEMNSTYISQVLEAMDIDDAVDILSHINERNMIASYLSVMRKEKAFEMRKLLQYEEKTAGSIMTTNFIELPINMDVKQAMKKLIKEANEAETIYTLYIIDPEKELLGTLSLRDLILARAGELIKDIMTTKVISVSADIDQENVAYLMKNYDLNALPVVDYQNHIIGIITVDDIIDVIHEEASEDYERFAAVTDIDEKIEQNAWQNAVSRLPWLILLLFLGLVNSNLLNLFENTLSSMVVLSFFLPLIAGMAGNTGTQSLAITIRKLTINPLTLQEKLRHVLKEAITGLIIGFITAIIAFILIYIVQSDLIIASLVSISILISLIVSTAAGAFVPLIISRFKIDPAVASGPFITTLNDLISITIYLGLATVFINQIL